MQAATSGLSLKKRDASRSQDTTNRKESQYLTDALLNALSVKLLPSAMPVQQDRISSQTSIHVATFALLAIGRTLLL